MRRDVLPHLLLLLLIALAFPRAAVAEELHVRLEYAVPGDVRDCQGREPIFRAMVDYHQRTSFFTPPADHLLSVQVKRSRRGYDARVALLGLDGTLVEERQAHYPPSVSCFEVIYYAALDSTQVLRIHRPPAPPPSPPPPLPPPPPPSPPCPACKGPAPVQPVPRPARPDTRLRWRVLGGFLYDDNVGPEPAPGAQLGVQLQGRWWSLEVDGRYTLHKESVPKISVLTSFTAGGAFVPCVRWEEVAGCGVVSAGVLGWTTHWAQEIYDAAPYLGFGARVTMEKKIPVRLASPLAVRLELEGAYNPLSPVMRGQRDATVSHGRRITAHGGVSLIATF